MDKKEEEFQRKLLSIFRIEAKEHLTTITSGLIELEKPTAGDRPELLETIYRESHSLKGAARSVNLGDAVAVCQSLENVFAALKRKEIETSPNLFDILHRAADTVAGLVGMEEEMTSSGKASIKELIRDIETIVKGTAPLKIDQHPKEEKESRIDEEPDKKELKGSNTSPGEKTFAVPETVRIPAAKLDALLFRAEEMLSFKLAAAHRADELQEIASSCVELEKKMGEIAFHRNKTGGAA